MLNLGRLNNLAESLGLERNSIACVLDSFQTNPSSLVKELTVWRTDPSKKPRDVICMLRPWRRIQQRVYTKLLLPHLRPSKYSHGGVRGRSPATNARCHLGNTFAFVADISGFFPAISCSRVNALFLRLACSYEVARILTRLCTYDFHLAQGLITSPILANEIFKPIDRRIGDACRKMELTYSRFVDDITISGKFNLKRSGIHSVIESIVERHGFSLSQSKTDWGRLDDDLSIAGVRLKRDHLDAPKKFIIELDRLINDHTSLGKNGHFDGPLLMEGELFGKAHFACSMNPGRRRDILSKLKAIDWSAVLNNAIERDLVRVRERTTPRGEPRPDCVEPLPGSAGARNYREFCESTAIDANTAPFETTSAS
jgi:RNA-directed DNA polymerase